MRKTFSWSATTRPVLFLWKMRQLSTGSEEGEEAEEEEAEEEDGGAWEADLTGGRACKMLVAPSNTVSMACCAGKKGSRREGRGEEEDAEEGEG